MMTAPRAEPPLEDRLCVTFEVLRCCAGLRSGDPTAIERSRMAFMEDPAPFDGEYAWARLPSPPMKKEDILSLVTSSIRSGYVAVVDVGCFAGDFFTADMARFLGERGKVFGADPFDPAAFSQDTITGDRQFETREDVLAYLQDRHPLPNLRFIPLEVGRRTTLDPYLKKARQRIVTGFRIPDQVSCYAADAAVDAGASQMLFIPVGTGRMAPSEQEFTPRSKYMQRNGELALDADRLHGLLNLEFRMRARRDTQYPDEGRYAFTATDEYERFNYQLNMLAKQLVMLDRAMHLQEQGYTATVARYEDGFGWGTSAQHHILIARRE